MVKLSIDLAVALFVWLPPITAAHAQEAPYSLFVEPPSGYEQVKAGLSVFIDLHAKNLSDHDMMFLYGAAEEQFRIYAWYRDGRPAKMTPFAEVSYGLRDYNPKTDPQKGVPAARDFQAIRTSISPGDEFMQSMNASRFFVLSDPGVYLIQVQRTETIDNVSVRIKSNVTSVEVVK